VLGDYVDWDDSQQAKFDAVVVETLQWHQASQLEQYHLFLGDIRRDISTPLSAKPIDFLQLQSYYRRGETLSNAIMAKTLPDTQYLLNTLSAAQIDSVLAELDQKSADLKKKYADLTEQEWRDQRVKRMRKLAKRFVGRLDDSQAQLIVDWSAGLEDVRQPWFEQRTIWRDRFEQALSNKENPNFSEEIELLFLRSEELVPEHYEVQWQRSIESAIQMGVALVNSLSDKQRSKLDKSLAKYQGYVEKLQAASVPQ
jgi:hypothetical protein